MKIHVIHKLFNWDTGDTVWVVSGSIDGSPGIATFTRDAGCWTYHLSSMCFPHDVENQRIGEFALLVFDRVGQMIEEDAYVYFG